MHVQLRRSTEIGTINHKKDILKPIACNWLHLYNQEHKKKITHNTKPFYIPVQHLMSHFACILLEYTQHIYTIYIYTKSNKLCVSVYALLTPPIPTPNLPCLAYLLRARAYAQPFIPSTYAPIPTFFSGHKL